MTLSMLDQLFAMALKANLLPILGLSALRMLGVTLMLPLLGRQSVGGGLIRNALFFIFSWPVMMHYLLNNADLFLPLEQPVALALLVLQELLVGLIIGFCATVPFWALDAGCFLIDTLRGSSMSSAMNPLLGSNSSGLGLFFSHLISVFFLESGGLESLLLALYQSFKVLPLGSTFDWDHMPWLDFFKIQWQLIFTLGLSFALPAVVMMVLVDVGLGLLNRAATQLNVFFIAMPIKSALCIFMMAVSLEFVLSIYLENMQGISGALLTLWGGNRS